MTPFKVTDMASLKANLAPDRTREIHYWVGNAKDSFSATWKPGLVPAIIPPEGFHLKDLITSDQVQKTIAQAAALNVAIGEDETPLLGDSIYDSQTSADFPRVLSGQEFMYGECVFAEVKEGQEILQGSIRKVTTDGLTIYKYATLFEITEETQMYNEAFVIDAKSRAMGEGYRKLVNDLRLNPIISAAYAAPNQTGAVRVNGAGETVAANAPYDLFKSIYYTLLAGMEAAKDAGRPASVVLCSSRDAYRIAIAASGFRRDDGLVFPPLGITDIIAYDGDSVTVGGVTTTYTGCTNNTVYLIRPKKGFYERIKMPYTVGLGDADASRGVLNEIIGKTYRGYYAAPLLNVEQVTLPA